MIQRTLLALGCISIASSAMAGSFVISGVDICPPPSYTGIALAVPGGTPGLATAFGPTPRGLGAGDGKCGITEMRTAMGTCPLGVQAHYSHDTVDLWSDTNPPINRVFREALHINTFDGIPIGGRVRFAEVVFFNGERVGFYFDRPYLWSSDFAVTHTGCEYGCSEEEVGRFSFPMGLIATGPGAEAVPITITWTTGRHVQTARNVGWTLSYAGPTYSPIYMGSVELTAGTREVRFDHGIVNASCEGGEATRIRFVKPRFEVY